MTPKQLKEETTTKLLIAFKNKARCFHSQRKANAIYQELKNRLGAEKLYNVRLEWSHMQHGEPDAMFNYEIDLLINESNPGDLNTDDQHVIVRNSKTDPDALNIKIAVYRRKRN